MNTAEKAQAVAEAFCDHHFWSATDDPDIARCDGCGKQKQQVHFTIGNTPKAGKLPAHHSIEIACAPDSTRWQRLWHLLALPWRYVVHGRFWL